MGTVPLGALCFLANVLRWQVGWQRGRQQELLEGEVWVGGRAGGRARNNVKLVSLGQAPRKKGCMWRGHAGEEAGGWMGGSESAVQV